MILMSQALEILLDINPARLTKSVATRVLDASDEGASRLSDADGNATLAAAKLIGAACIEHVATGHRGCPWITRRVTRDMALPEGAFRLVQIKGQIAVDSRDLDCMEEAA